MMDAATLIHALDDRTRLAALVLMRTEGVLCVCELTAVLGVSQPKMSRHLAAMRCLGVVEDCRVANRVFYRIALQLPDWAHGIIDNLVASFAESGERAVLTGRLAAMPSRPPRPHRDEQWRDAAMGTSRRHVAVGAA